MTNHGPNELQFRDPARARALAAALTHAVDAIGRDVVSVMHVCGSHEQAIARFGLRATLPTRLNVIMGPGCPVCITDVPEVDEGVALARQGVRMATYGDMVKVPGTVMSLGDVKAEGARIDVVYSVSQAVELARRAGEPVVFFATGFETTAVATAAAILDDPPPNFFVLSAHKYIPPVMEIVAEMPDTRVEGFLAAGHAATITGWGVFEPFVERHQLPVVVAGFEPLDILAGLVKLVELVRDRRPAVENMFPRCVTREGNLRAQERAVARVQANRRPLARHRPRAQRQPAAARRVRASRRSALLRYRPGVAVGLRARRAGAGLHLRRHHGRHQVADRLHAVRHVVRARLAGRRLHGEQRRDVPHLASIRRTSGS